jgi:hypothetical protein
VGVDGLVALEVTQPLVDIGWKRDVADLGEVGLDGLGKADEALGAFEDFEDLSVREWIT